MYDYHTPTAQMARLRNAFQYNHVRLSLRRVMLLSTLIRSFNTTMYDYHLGETYPDEQVNTVSIQPCTIITTIRQKVRRHGMVSIQPCTIITHQTSQRREPVPRFNTTMYDYHTGSNER